MKTSRPSGKSLLLGAAACLALGLALAASGSFLDPWLAPRGLQGSFYVLGMGLAQASPLLALAAALSVMPEAAWGRLPPWISAAALLAALAVLAPPLASRMALGQRHWFLSDDQMISMCFARNLAEGRGLSWNGARIEGFSNLLWTLGMALPLKLGLPLRLAPLAVILACFAIAWLASLELDRLAAHFGLERGARCLLALGFACLSPTVIFAIDGLEMLPIAWLGLRSLRLGLVEGAGPARLWPGLSAMAMLRADGFVWAGLFCLPLAPRLREPRRLFQLALGPVLATLACRGFSLAYYGAWMPNTVTLKTAYWPGREAAGLRYIAIFAAHHAFALALAAWGALRGGWALKSFMALILLDMAYVMMAGGDFEFFHRFLYPTLPLLLLLAFFGARELRPAGFAAALGLYLALAVWDWRLSLGLLYPIQWGQAFNSLALLPLLLAAAAAALAFRREPGVAGLSGMVLVLLALPLYPPRLGDFAALRNSEVLDEALWLRDHGAHGASVAEPYAGLIYYYSGFKGVDILGKCDAVVARLEARPGIDVPGHNKFDMDYSLSGLKPRYVGSRPPDFIASALKDPERAGRLKQGRILDFEEAVYSHPYFIARCLPHPVWLGKGHALYDCR